MEKEVSTLVIFETHKNQDGPRRRWIIPFPDCSKDRKQVLAYNCFFCGTKQYNWKNKKGDYTTYTGKDEFAMKLHEESIKRHAGVLFDDLPPVPLDSLWQFFEAVGFDYKAKKWLPKTDTI